MIIRIVDHNQSQNAKNNVLQKTYFCPDIGKCFVHVVCCDFGVGLDPVRSWLTAFLCCLDWMAWLLMNEGQNHFKSQRTLGWPWVTMSWARYTSVNMAYLRPSPIKKQPWLIKWALKVDLREPHDSEATDTWIKTELKRPFRWSSWLLAYVLFWISAGAQGCGCLVVCSLAIKKI